LLLQANADVSACAQDNKGNSALHLASTRNACGVARVLLKYGARVDLQNKDGKTPLTIETAGAEVLKILRGEDPGAGSDPARQEQVANLPVAMHMQQAHTATSQEQGVSEVKSQADASASSIPASAVVSSAAAPTAAASQPAANSSTSMAQQSSSGGKLSGGGKGLASAPSSRPDKNEEEEDDDESEEDDDDSDEEDIKQAPDSLASANGVAAGVSEGGSSGVEPAAAPEASAAADEDEDESSESDDDD